MKKSLIALAVSGLAVASVANAAPQADSFYVGAKAGWATFHNDINQLNFKYKNDARYATSANGYGINRNSVTYGVFGGYQIIDNLAVELGYDYFGRVRGNKQEFREFKHSAHGTHLSLKPSYEVLSGLDVYGKVGAALVRNDYKRYFQTREPVKSHNLKTSLIVGAGVEYAILPELAFRVEYQWLSRVGNANKAAQKRGDTAMFGPGSTYSPDAHSVSAGISYRFGQGAAPVAAAPEVVTKNFAFSSDVLFDFGKANLKPAAAQTLDAVHTEIVNLGLANPAVQVNGYTDRIGKDAANLTLSQKRAETVANYIVSKGVNPANVTAVGYGEANPVTGITCDAVKGRKALITCLAPDRRVEIQVQGSKEVSM
ncbi:porin OmpA [Glaesserella parasuis]|nr:porin OmpA [Glaesserella parasuis]